MRRGFWTELGFPATTVLLAGVAVYHFVIGHGRAAPPVPAALVVAPTAWPPSPDSAALRALPLPVRARFSVVDPDSLNGLALRYDGALVLDADGLTFEVDAASQVRAPDVDPLFTLDSLILAVAEPDPATGWRIVAQSEPWTQGGQAAARASYRVPLSLRIDGLTAVDLAGRWPLLIHVLDRPPLPPDQGVHEAHPHFVHQGHRGIFDDMLAGRPRELR